jgi:hypothetical protein
MRLSPLNPFSRDAFGYAAAFRVLAWHSDWPKIGVRSRGDFSERMGEMTHRPCFFHECCHQSAFGCYTMHGI